jgi:hypothetical protein
VKSSALLVALAPPPVVVTTTSTTPTAWAGEMAVTDVLEFTVTPVAAVPPKVTPLAPVRLLPVIVTLVPPAIGPEVGATPDTVGAGAVAAISAPIPDDVPAGDWAAVGVSAADVFVSHKTMSVVVGNGVA